MTTQAQFDKIQSMIKISRAINNYEEVMHAWKIFHSSRKKRGGVISTF